MTITVRGGFTPDTVLIEAGRPVRLRFFRDETSQSSEDLRFPTLDIQTSLAPFKTTTVEFTPEKPGDYPFQSSGSLQGTVVARPPGRVRGKGHSRHG